MTSNLPDYLRAAINVGSLFAACPELLAPELLELCSWYETKASLLSHYSYVPPVCRLINRITASLASEGRVIKYLFVRLHRDNTPMRLHMDGVTTIGFERYVYRFATSGRSTTVSLRDTRSSNQWEHSVADGGWYNLPVPRSFS